MASEVFVGRGRELAVLTGLAARARADQPRVVLIEGDAGMGKSSLLAKFVPAVGGAAVLRAKITSATFPPRAATAILMAWPARSASGWALVAYPSRRRENKSAAAGGGGLGRGGRAGRRERAVAAGRGRHHPARDGLTVHPVAVLSRAGCLAGGVLVGATALSYQRHWRGACLACGRTGQAAAPARPPRWAWAAAWAAVTGCLVRLLAQAAVGFGSQLLRAGGSGLLFEAGFLLAGTVLPLALVYRWGRVFPGWVPLRAGRGVPRWLVLGPALALGAGMTAYFGVTIVRLAAGTVTGTWAQHAGPYPLWFFWVAVPGYLAWGLGLGAAALAYRRATRPACRTCGR